MGIDFNSKTTYGDDSDNYIKTKVKTYADIVITNFHNKKIPKEKVPSKCLSIIILDSVIESTNIFRRMQICTRKNKI